MAPSLTHQPGSQKDRVRTGKLVVPNTAVEEHTADAVQGRPALTQLLLLREAAHHCLPHLLILRCQPAGGTQSLMAPVVKEQGFIFKNAGDEKSTTLLMRMP